MSAGSDAIRGASILIEAIGDGRRSAQKIVEYSTGTRKENSFQNRQEENFAAYHKKLVQRVFGLPEDEIQI